MLVEEKKAAQALPSHQFYCMALFCRTVSVYHRHEGYALILCKARNQIIFGTSRELQGKNGSSVD